MRHFAYSLVWLCLCMEAASAQRGGMPGGGMPGGGMPGGGGGGRPGGGGGFNPGGGGFNPGGGGFNPGGNRPGVPNIPNPGGPNPFNPNASNPGVFNPGGAPSPFNPTPGGNRPGVPNLPTPPSPFQVNNPFNANSRVVPTGMPIHVTNPNLPTFGSAHLPGFQQAQNYARSNNGPELTNFINNHVQTNNGNLNNMFTAVNALHGVNNPAYNALRTSTMNLAQQQISQGVNQPTPWVVVAQMSLQDRNMSKFNEATQTLAQKFPNSEYSHFFQGVQHLQNRDFKKAEQALKQARELGMPEESIAELMRVAIDNQKWIWEYALVVAVLVGVWLAGLLGLFLIGKIFSARTLAKLHKAPCETTAGDRWLRRWYRRVIGAAGFYYYVSLPMVLLVAVALPMTLGYGLLRVPFLNLFLVVVTLFLGLAGILTAISGLRTAFLRVKPIEGGRIVSEEELPGLWTLARDVAKNVGTRPVDEIRLTWGSDLCVFETGGWRDRRNDRGKRHLVLGLGVLRGMKRDALTSILAHEYGHFQNRDTAGGDISLRVNLAMQNFANAIIKRGKIRWWDVAVHFLRFYHFIFRRLTFGASRLQEVLADRLAVELYGASALKEGLTHVIRRSIELEWSLNKSLDNHVKSMQPATHFFHAVPVPELREREQIEIVVKEVLERKTDAEDSHPSPRDRFQLAARIDKSDRPLADQYVWTLLVENEAIITELSESVAEMLKRDSLAILSDLDANIRTLSRVVRRHGDPGAILERARLYMTTAKYAEALDDLNEVVEIAPNAIGPRYMRGLVCKRLKRFGDALRDLNEVAKRVTSDKSDFRFQDPDFTADDQLAVLLALGECRAAEGDHAGAIKSFSNALRRQPTSLVALMGRGKSYAALRELNRAVADFDAAAERWPGSPEPRIARDRLAPAAPELLVVDDVAIE